MTVWLGTTAVCITALSCLLPHGLAETAVVQTATPLFLVLMPVVPTCSILHHLMGGAGRGGKEGDGSGSGGVGNRSQGGGSRARPLQEGHPRAQEEA